MNDYWLIVMILLPFLTALVITCGRAAAARWIALLGSLVTLGVSLRFAGPTFHAPGSYFSAVNLPWIQQFNISFMLGMDGLSGTLVLLTNILIPLSVLGSWTAITKRQKEFYFFLLLLQTGILGTFLALDLILFYIFWEIMLIPLYFLIGIFGSGRRIYATMKFFLYTFAGSVLMLLAILALYYQSRALQGFGTFALADLLKVTPMMAPHTQMLLFLAFFLAFAIKVPLFPLHTWLPDAHTEAPTAGSVILAGVLLKTGVYGIMRFAIPLFPQMAERIAPLVMVLSVIAIIYGALTAFAQTDMKRLVAYSSVSHMGFIVLGIFAFRTEAVTGAALQMLNHGISTGGLFLCVGYIYERRHTRDMAAFGGLAYNMKVYAVLTMVMMLASVGLPSLNGFVGEFLIMIGTFQASRVAAFSAGLGVILAACYLLRMMQMTFFGPLDKPENKVLKDLNLRETFTLVVLAVLAFWIGLTPNPCLRAVAPASQTVVQAVQSASAPAALASAESVAH